MEEKSKLAEQATAKADLSYSYWAANEAKDAPLPQPKQLTEEEAEQLRSASLHRSTSSSAWNAAGTFEERNLDWWVKDAVKELLVGATGERINGNSGAVIVEVVSCSGDCSQLVVRGSTRASFDLDLKLKWKVSEVDGDRIEGHVRIPNAAWDELDDLNLEIEVLTGEKKESGQTAAKALLPTIRKKLEELVEKIRAYSSNK